MLQMLGCESHQGIPAPWAIASLALLQVRMSGQDAERGTFNQRHHSVVDQQTSERLISKAPV